MGCASLDWLDYGMKHEQQQQDDQARFQDDGAAYMLQRTGVRSLVKCLCSSWCVSLQIRTVAAFGMEQITVDKYDKALELPEKVRSNRTLQQYLETA